MTLPLPRLAMPLAPKLDIRLVERMDDLERCMRVRFTVFCEEQGVPFEMEQDPYDTQATHWLALDRNRAVGTVRVVVKGTEGTWQGKLGRLAVLAPDRGRGVGARLMAEALAWSRRRGLAAIVLHAQVEALGFYEKLGFVAEGEEFMEADIRHRRMRLNLAVEDTLRRRDA